MQGVFLAVARVWPVLRVIETSVTALWCNVTATSSGLKHLEHHASTEMFRYATYG